MRKPPGHRPGGSQRINNRRVVGGGGAVRSVGSVTTRDLSPVLIAAATHPPGEMLVVARSHRSGQDLKALFLRVVEALVERTCRIGETLERRTARGQRLS